MRDDMANDGTKGENSKLQGKNGDMNEGYLASISVGEVLGVAVAICLLVIIALIVYIIR